MKIHGVSKFEDSSFVALFWKICELRASREAYFLESKFRVLTSCRIASVYVYVLRQQRFLVHKHILKNKLKNFELRKTFFGAFRCFFFVM